MVHHSDMPSPRRVAKDHFRIHDLRLTPPAVGLKCVDEDPDVLSRWKEAYLLEDLEAVELLASRTRNDTAQLRRYPVSGSGAGVGDADVEKPLLILEVQVDEGRRARRGCPGRHRIPSVLFGLGDARVPFPALVLQPDGGYRHRVRAGVEAG